MDDFVEVRSRIQAVESDVKYLTAEVGSLRSSRHEHANWMTRLDGDIREVKQRVDESIHKRLCDAEEEVISVKKVIDTHNGLINGLITDARIAAWKIGMIIGALVFILDQAAKRIKL